LIDVAPDQAQRDIATDVRRSVIVQAPAGSGKTTLLVERYLKLLAIVERPEQILAITFTRKAASEMQSRVLDALSSAAAATGGGTAGSDVARRALARSEEMGWELLDTPGRLKIQTIDSFALALTRGLPVTSGFDPALGLTENASDLYRQAASQLLLRLYDDDPLTDEIADFLLQCGNDGMRAERLLASMLSRRDQWLQIIADVVATHRDDPDRVGEVLQLGLNTLNEEVVGHFDARLDPRDRLDLKELADHAAAELGIDIAQPWARYRLIGTMLTTTADEFRKQVTRRDGFTTDHPETKARVMALIERLAERGLDKAVANLRYLPDPVLDQQAVRRLVTVCITLALAASELGQAFQKAGANDFTTLILNAQTALGHAMAPTELALALDYRINHILVDEFQDTSVSQFRLFERLLEGWTVGDDNSFFAVGDPMQSIYRFRDADVGLFFQAWEQGIADVTLEGVTLTSNFRANPALIRWTNLAFANIMGSIQEPTLGQIAYRAATPTRPEGSEQPAVAVQLDGHPAGQVQTVAARVESLLADTQDSIAVLVSARSHLTALIAELRRRGISWHANDIDPLLNKPAVRDLVNLIGALENSRDRLTWFSVLRSPLVGLTLSDLQQLEADDFSMDLSGTGAAELSASGKRRLARLSTAWDAIGGHIHEQPPRSVLETLWLRLGGADAYEDPAALVHATRLLELVDELGADGRSMTTVRQAAVNLFASDITDSRLEILTIHKAKGLEFDHVLLPFLDRTTRSDEAELLLWRALPHGLLMGIRDEAGPFEWLAREDKFRERNERQRLLYVACTRARRSLSLFATESARPSQATALGLLMPTIEAAAEMIVEHEAEAEPPVQVDLFSEPEEDAPPPLKRLKDDYVFELPAREAIAIERPRSGRSMADPLDARREVVLGIVVHAALERLAGSLPPDPSSWITAQIDRWRAMADHHDLAPDDAEWVIDAVCRQLADVMTDPDGRWLLSAHPGAEAEFPVTTVIDGQFQNLIFDRTFEAEGERWLVDYKTAVPAENGDLEAFVREEVSRYRGQLARYAEAAEALFGRRPLIAIYFTALPRLVRL
jgi:ATP-dependent exoDNAse (exonuclease V) beta subunit